MTANSDIDNGLADRLKHTSSFSAYSVAELQSVLRFCKERRAARGEALFRQGERCDAVFVLVTGSVKLTRQPSRGREKIVQLVFSGMSIGETALLSPTCPVTAVALEQCDLLEIRAREFTKFLRQHSKPAWRMMEELSKRLCECIEQLEHSATRNVPQKVASFLLDRCSEGESSGTPAPSCPRIDIANYLSIRPETLSRTIRRFKERKWIKVEQGDIVVTDAPSLSRIVSDERALGHESA